MQPKSQKAPVIVQPNTEGWTSAHWEARVRELEAQSLELQRVHQELDSRLNLLAHAVTIGDTDALDQAEATTAEAREAAADLDTISRAARFARIQLANVKQREKEERDRARRAAMVPLVESLKADTSEIDELLGKLSAVCGHAKETCMELHALGWWHPFKNRFLGRSLLLNSAAARVGLDQYFNFPHSGSHGSLRSFLPDEEGEPKLLSDELRQFDTV